MKIIKNMLFAFVMLFVLVLPVSAQESHTVYEKQVQQITEENGIDLQQIKQAPLETIWDAVKKAVVNGTGNNLSVFAKIAAILLITSLVNLFTPDDNSQIAKIVSIVSVAAIFNGAIHNFTQQIGSISESMFDIKNFMIAFMPVFAGVSFASGEMITSTVYTGFFLISIVSVANFCINYIIPSLNVFMAVGVTSAVSSVFDLKPLCEFYSKAVKTAMTAAVSVLCFMLSVQTTITQGQDTLAVKTGKMIVTSAVPVIGSALQGAVSSVYTSMGVLKGFFGLAGIAVIIGIFMPGIVSLAANWAGYSVLIVISKLLENKAAADILDCFRQIVEIMLSMTVLFMVLLVFSMSVMIKLIQGV